mgnify:CR=1 FL=1
MDVVQAVSPILALTRSAPKPVRRGPASTRRISRDMRAGTVMKYQLDLPRGQRHNFARRRYTDSVAVEAAAFRVVAGKGQPRLAASIPATSIFFIFIIALKTRWRTAGSGSAIPCVSTTGVICQEMPQRSLHQPHWLS